MGSVRSAVPVLMAVLLAVSSASAEAVFGSAAFRMADQSTPREWRRVTARLAAEADAFGRCLEEGKGCPGRFGRALHEMAARLTNASEARRIETVNAFFNRLSYRTDQQVWNRSDYWATPLEFLRFSGDCEDYAIAKYTTLAALGVPESRMRLVVLQDTRRDVVHAVLAISSGDDTLVLDNLQERVVSHRRLTSYAPYYSVNADGAWAHVEPLTGRAAASR